jgi:hypothetical protein
MKITRFSSLGFLAAARNDSFRVDSPAKAGRASFQNDVIPTDREESVLCDTTYAAEVKIPPHCVADAEFVGMT